MRVTGPGEAPPPRALRRGRVGGERFVLPETVAGQDGEAAEAAPAGGAATAQGLAAMLAMQESALSASVDMPARRDQQARRRGQDLLGALSDLQRALLGQGAASGSLAALRALLDGLPVAADPALAGILGAIALRARIELARAEG